MFLGDTMSARIWKKICRAIQKYSIKALAVLALFGVFFLGLGGAHADNATDSAQAGFNMLNNLLPTLIGFFVVMMVFSFIGGFFAGMTRAMNRMQFQ